MEHAELVECINRIVGDSNEALQAVEGLALLQRQGETLVMQLDQQAHGKVVPIEGVREGMTKLYTWLDLVRITVDHARESLSGVQDTAYELMAEKYKEA